MTKQQVIDILEAYKPSDNIYNGYDSIEKKVDDKICSLINEIIERVKQEPEVMRIKCKPEPNSGWIKCSKMLPKCHEEVLVCNDYGEISTAMLCEREREWFSGDGYYNLKAFTHWAPLPEPPKEDD